MAEGDTEGKRTDQGMSRAAFQTQGVTTKKNQGGRGVHAGTWHRTKETQEDKEPVVGRGNVGVVEGRCGAV